MKRAYKHDKSFKPESRRLIGLLARQSAGRERLTVAAATIESEETR
jgi:hypothetical protein